MADITKSPRRRGAAAKNAVQDQTDQGQDTVDDVQDTASDEGDERQESGENGSGGDTPTLTSELKDTIREAAIEVLRPVARKATTSAAKYAVTKGPDLVKDKVAPKITEAGGAGALAKGVAGKGGGIATAVGGVASGIGEKIGGKGKSKAPTGHGRGRRLPVQEYIDVGVDIQTAYDQYTQFEDWPNFMHRLEKVEQRDDTTLMFHENIWGVRRQWEAEIVEQLPCERVVWRSQGGTQTVGVVTFHKLAENLTRIQVNMDFQPKGLFEKTASGMRISRRALRSDLMRFKAFIEMRDDATGEWRGRIEDAEVVEEPGQGDEGQDETEASGQEQDQDEPQASEDEDEEREQPEASEEEDEDYDEDEEPEASEEEDDEPEASEEEGYADEDEEPEDDEEPEPAPAPRRRSKPKATAGAPPRRRR